MRKYLTDGGAVRWRRGATHISSRAMFAAVALVPLTVSVPVDVVGPARASHVCATTSGCLSFTQTKGVTDATEPSGKAPPLANALAGYRQTYVTDFGGTSLPAGWGTYAGQPGGDVGTQWQPSHVVVSNGQLQLNAGFDPTANEWITGGVSQNSVSTTYGAYFVRSRITAPGPTIVELLWPTQNVWPPEIDFNETYGATTSSMATVHFGTVNNVDHRTVSIDMTKWHTWGVVWTPTSLTYVVDGVVWGVVTQASEIPSIAMHLAIQQQTWCSQNFACPTAPASAVVDWVAEYAPTSTAPSGGASVPQNIAIDASLPLNELNVEVVQAAKSIVSVGARDVVLEVATLGKWRAKGVSPSKRVAQVMSLLERYVQRQGLAPLRIFVHWFPANPRLAGNRPHVVIHAVYS